MKNEKLRYCFPLRFKSFGGCIAMMIGSRGIPLWVPCFLPLKTLRTLKREIRIKKEKGKRKNLCNWCI